MIDPLLFGFSAWLADKIGGKIFDVLTGGNPNALDQLFNRRAKDAIVLLEKEYDEEYHAAISHLFAQKEAQNRLYTFAVQGLEVPDTAFDPLIDSATLPTRFANTVVRTLRQEMRKEKLLEEVIGRQELLDILSSSNKHLEKISGVVEAGHARFTEKEELQQLLMRSYHEYLDATYWTTKTISEAKKREALLINFYTHIDKGSIPQAIQNEIAIAPQPLHTTINVDGEFEERELEAILSEAVSHSFSLVKILTDDGGMGKSTFLYWIAKFFHPAYHIFSIKKIDEASMEHLFSMCITLLKGNPKPILFLIDDVAEVDLSTKIGKLFDSARVVSEEYANPMVFIVADRKGRYTQRYHKKLDSGFVGRSQNILYKPVKKREVFDAIYNSLSQKHGALLDPMLRANAERLYMSPNVASLSESLKNLLDLLKLHDIQYEFDWIEWDTFIKENQEYKALKTLFAQVVCFYQFGIKLPLDYFGKKVREKIIGALGDSENSRKPILLSEDQSSLALNHEHVATWFLQEPKGRLLVKEAFKNFLNDIDEEHAARLFRKIRKLVVSDSKELEASVINDLINANKCLEVITAYLKRSDIIPLERSKMTMEKALVLLYMERENEAIELLEEIYHAGNHAKDRLARIYTRKKMYQRAFDTYMDILDNQGYYAILSLYRLMQKCKRENIILKNTRKSEDDTLLHSYSIESLTLFSSNQTLEKKIEGLKKLNLDSFYVHEFVKEFIQSEEFEYAELFLESIETPKPVTAECHYKLAQSLRFIKENIEKKKRHYEQAIKINGQLNPHNRNINYTVDFAVFLYRICEFSKSTQIMKTALAQQPDPLRKNSIDRLYKSNIHFTRRLYFKDIPSKNNLPALRAFLIKQYDMAGPMVSPKTPLVTILQGFFVLRTIAAHSSRDQDLRDIYFMSVKRMASCYMHNMKKDWNTLTQAENRRIAENLYDTAYRLNPDDQEVHENMVKNLVQMEDTQKAQKALFLCSKILEAWHNHTPALYRLQGNAHKILKQYQLAFRDYEKALELLKKEAFNEANDHMHVNNKCSTLNNIATLICDCIEENIVPEGYKLQNARTCCHTIEQLNPKFYFLAATRERIERIAEQSN